MCCTRTSCCVFTVVKIIGDKLKKAFHRISELKEASHRNVSVNSIVDTLAHFSKSNIAEYDNESPNAYRTSTEHMILCFDEQANRLQVEVVTGILFIAPLHDHVSNGDPSQVFLEQQMSLTS